MPPSSHVLPGNTLESLFIPFRPVVEAGPGYPE